jgi:hypothetical protein
MKRTIYLVGILVGVIMAGAAVFWGCNNEGGDNSLSMQSWHNPGEPVAVTPTSSLLFSAGNSTLEATSFRFIPTDRVLELQLRERLGNGEMRPLVFSLAEKTGPARSQFLKVDLTDASGNLLWEFSQARPDSLVREAFVWEKTNKDSLFIHQFEKDSSFEETYDLNGHSHAFKFAGTDQSRIRYWHSKVLTDGYAVAKGAVVSASDAAIINTVSDFHSFYSTDNSLNNNVDGQLAMHLLQSEQLAGWIRSGVAGPSDSSNAETITQMPEYCYYALDCMVLKCPEGINPLCEVCGGVVLVCIVRELMDQLGIK